MRASTLVLTMAIVFVGARTATGGPEQILTGRVGTEHFEIRFRPGSRAGASVERAAVMVERDLARIDSLMGIETTGRLELLLYDGVGELSAITRTDGNAGFSAGRAIHIPFGNDQTRFHELAHAVENTWPRSGNEHRNAFFADGLANALLEFVHGVHVDAVAAYPKRRGKLPALAEMIGQKDFYAWLRKRPGFNAYDVGGSWFRHLLETHGPAKVRSFYTRQSARKALGTTMEKLERDWHAHLDAYEIRPEVETLLRRRDGEPAQFVAYPLDPDARLPAEILGKPSQWTVLTGAGLRTSDASGWTRDGKAIRGRNSSMQWSWCELGTAKYADCVVRATIKPSPGTVGVQLRLGEHGQAMLTNAGTFVWRDRPTAASHEDRLGGEKEIDFLLVRRDGVMEIWLDGFEIVSGRVGSDPASVGIGVAGGSATFVDVRVRRLGAK